MSRIIIFTIRHIGKLRDNDMETTILLVNDTQRPTVVHLTLILMMIMIAQQVHVMSIRKNAGMKFRLMNVVLYEN